MRKIIEEMKNRLKETDEPVLKREKDNLMANGFTEDEAIDIMVSAWLYAQLR